jgi:chromosome segregation protein
MREQEQSQVSIRTQKGTRINRIVMNGFKSFAKHTEIPFSPSYNCVIGPNGSGKSNILDALSFVLGKSSSKSMRAEKSSNLIYNGGKSKKPSKNGEVSLFFDNSDKLFPTEDPEVKISRIVRQTGQSIYKINDETRTRQEMLDLLSLAKINPDGYNIILQGDIVKFVEMHPDQRRELIGEIAGINIYEDKKHKALLELQKVDDRLKETEIVLAERSTYLKELKKDRDQALKYKDMNDKIRINQASYLKHQIDRKNSEKSELQKKLDSSKEELDSINGKINEIKSLNEEKRKEIESINKEIERKGEVEQVELNKVVENLKIELTKKSTRVDALKTEIIKISNRRKDLQNTIKDVREKIRSLEEDKLKMEREVNAKKKEQSLTLSKIKGFKDKHNLENLGNIEKQVEEIDKRADEIQKEVQSAREQQHGLIRQKDRISHDLSSLDSQLMKVAQIESENKKLVDSVKLKKNEFKRSTLELNKALEEDSTLTAKITDCRKRIFAADEELAKLRAKEVSTKELSYADIAIKRILELKKSNPQIYGTISDLGNVKSKYALALEIAVGNKLKSIVVENDKIASDCIKFLKEKKLGVVTFFPLNKIKGSSIRPDIKKLSTSNGSHGMALDLVSYENKFRKVFEHVLADTIVIESIDVARRLGIGLAKYVTLDGDIADKSGAMHGGYRIKRKHSLGFKEQDIVEDISKFESLLDELKTKKGGMDSRRGEIEEIINDLRSKKAVLEADIVMMEKSLNLEASDLEATGQKKKILLDEEKSIDAKVSLVQEKISTLNSELTNLKTEKQKLRNNITHLNNPVLIAELNAFEEKQRELSESIIRVDSEIKNIDMQSESIFKSDLEKTDKIISQIDREEIAFKEELGKLEDEMAKRGSDLKEKESHAQEFYIRFKGLFHQRSQIDQEIQKNQNKINSKIEESRKVEVHVNTLSLKSAEMESILAGLRHEFQQFEGVKIDLVKNEDQLKYEIKKFEKMREQIGSVNMRALEIYEEVEKQYNDLVQKKDKLSSEREDVVRMMDEIEGKKKELFIRVFDNINGTFKKFFSILTTKGSEANLVVEDENNPFEAGVRINVKITGSKFLDIRSLSGGEKTMTALAFIFAIQEFEPASFYILDEVDAALDKHNSEKFANLIKQYADKAQYIIMSHNDNVISEADNLFGISMNEHGISQVVSLRV